MDKKQHEIDLHTKDKQLQEFSLQKQRIAKNAFLVGLVVWVILSEIYPTKIRGRAMSIATMAVWIGTAFLGQFLPLSLDNLGPSVTFWIFGFFCIPTMWIGWKIMPETKGKTLEEIEKYWLEHKFRK